MCEWMHHNPYIKTVVPYVDKGPALPHHLHAARSRMTCAVLVYSWSLSAAKGKKINSMTSRTLRIHTLGWAGWSEYGLNYSSPPHYSYVGTFRDREEIPSDS